MNPETRNAKWGENAKAGEEERELSGRFRVSTLCDCCSKPLGRLDLDGGNHYTDDEVCGSSDGPGFYLCGRVACGKVYDEKSVEERRVIFTAGREWNRAVEDRREQKKATWKKPTPFSPTNAQFFKVLNAYPVGGPVSNLIGLGMLANLLEISEEHALIVANQMVNYGRFQRLADNAWKRTL